MRSRKNNTEEESRRNRFNNFADSSDSTALRLSRMIACAPNDLKLLESIQSTNDHHNEPGLKKARAPPRKDLHKQQPGHRGKGGKHFLGQT